MKLYILYSHNCDCVCFLFASFVFCRFVCTMEFMNLSIMQHSMVFFTHNPIRSNKSGIQLKFWHILNDVENFIINISCFTAFISFSLSLTLSFKFSAKFMRCTRKKIIAGLHIFYHGDLLDAFKIFEPHWFEPKNFSVVFFGHWWNFLTDFNITKLIW